VTRDAIVAVDVGGTKMSVGIVSGAGGLVERRDAPTIATLDGDELFAPLAEMVRSLDVTGVVACGVGCGGPMDRDGEHVSPLNIPAWRDFPLRSRLADLTGLPTYVDNDAKALALGEGWVGAAAGCDNFVGIVVSTGVGGGIVLDGRLLDGADGNAGHIGHVIVEPDGHVCGCGARGCVEAEASGTAIRRIFGLDPRDAPPEIVERTGRLVGRAVASVANLLDLRLAVVAGSVALGYGDPFFAAAQREIDDRCQVEFTRDRVRIVPAKLGPDAPLIGAARVALVHRDRPAHP
jgi:glucokinase